jgi:transposase
MMGRLECGQGRLFYDVRLDDLVPSDHLVRRLDWVLDLSWLHGEMKPYYSHTGRPSIDPELMMRMLIVGYVFAIRSERQLCSEVRVNLAYRWFCGLGLEDRVPDHSAFSRIRHDRFRDADVLRRVFEAVVERCIAEGLVGGKSLSVDASFIKADVNPVKRVGGDAPIEWPDGKDASRAVAEYLDALERVAAKTGEGGRRTATPKAVSLTDPQAAWVTKRQWMRPVFAYDANYLIDNKLGIVVDAEGTLANRIEENRACVTMVERVIRRFDLRPKRLAGDTAYGSGKTLKALVDCGIEPHIPVWDKSGQLKGKFTRADFTYDNERDLYVCPGGKTLTNTGHVDQGRIRPYRASTRDCRHCTLKPRCTSAPARKVSRDIDEEVRDHVRGLAKTAAFERSRQERKKVEMAFAHMKRIFKLDRLRLRGLSGARDEVLLTAMAQNLRKLARYAGPSPPALNFT